jgi:gas vesicle protein
MENTTRQTQNLRDQASKAAETAKEAGTSVMDRAKELAGSVSGEVNEMGRSLADKQRQATSAVGGGLKNVAGKIRESAPHSGVLGSASSTIADSLESSGEYIQERGFSGMANDVTDIVRNYPIPALLVGMGIGFLIGKAVTSRS